MNEDLNVLLGVLYCIPYHCLIIVVSNSTVDNNKAERAMLTTFCARSTRRALIVHQSDPSLASAFMAAGLSQIVHYNAGIKSQNGTGHVRSGKSEAMVIGAVLAKLRSK